MSTTAISAPTQQASTAALAESKASQRHSSGSVTENPDSRISQGLNLFASLLESLTQAVSQSNATTTAASGGASTATGPASSGTPSTGDSSGKPSSLGQDLQAFLHDLFHALRQAAPSHPRSGGIPDPTPIKPIPDPTPIKPIADPTPIKSTGPAPSTGGSGTSTTTGAHSYNDHGIVAALKALIHDLGNSKVVSGSGSSSGLSSGAISNLNTAFEKLLGDLGGTPGSSSDTTQLKSFLTNFLQDLQGNSSNAPSLVGSSINTTA